MAYNYVFFYHQRCGLSFLIWSGHTQCVSLKRDIGVPLIRFLSHCCAAPATAALPPAPRSHQADATAATRGYTGEFSKKKIFSKTFSSQYNVVDMVCCMNIYHERF
jgi:hypothetical protein